MFTEFYEKISCSHTVWLISWFLAQLVLHIFSSQGCFAIQIKVGKGTQFSQIFTEVWKNEKIIQWFTSCSHTVCLVSWNKLSWFSIYLVHKVALQYKNKRWKRDIIHSNIYRILQNVIQVIYPFLYVKYHDSTSSGSPYILFTRSFMA